MATGEPPRSSHGPSFGQGFGNVSTTWNGGIWGTSAIGSGLRNTTNETARIQGMTYPQSVTISGVVADSHTLEERLASAGSNEALTGSGSLLSTSESDGWNGRQRTPWPSMDNTSSGVSTTSTRRSGTSPKRRQNSSQQPSQALPDSSSSNPPYFSITPAPTHQSMLKVTQQQLPDLNSASYMSARALEPNGIQRPSRHNSDEGDRYAARLLALGNHDSGVSIQPQRQQSQSSTSGGFNSGGASRNGSLPPSRNGVDSLSRYGEDLQNTTYSRPTGMSSTGHNAQFKLSAEAHAFSRFPSAQNQRFGDMTNPGAMNNMTGDFAKMAVAKENNPPHTGYGTSMHSTFAGQGPSPYDFPPQIDVSNSNASWDTDEHGYSDFQDGHVQNNVAPFLPQASYRTSSLNPSYPHSPASSYGRRNSQSPYYSNDAAAPYALQHRPSLHGNLSANVPSGQAQLLDRKLRGIQQEQHNYLLPQMNPVHLRHPFPNPYDFHPSHAIRVNHLNQYYPAPPVSNLLPPVIPRGPAKDQDSSHSTRSACLEEFRTNSKTNKRYELKDIYGHIVEFSGDQHGSRFIQQKLETANSDEKDQAFREILPNAMQLMQDVFGNYVIQKFFEHGNQSQKKILASQMKGHVLQLSLQMYACRVVQKALEHILTDQQASLIGELQKDKQVMRCVKDQNGNHVVQKAIERIPAEHIQFIVNAFTGQVHELSKHAYGCRVIQRMLEHCVEPTRSAVLQELHGCAQYLIGDQYGNYVTQHVIEHGREQDRDRIITLVTSNLINYSKHKFASNVVETCIKFGNLEQRKKIVGILTAVNDKGDSNLQYLIRDQYCNYVIQTLILELKGAESDNFIEVVKPQVVILKRFNYSKQVQAIEQLLYNIIPPAQPLPRSTNPVPPPIDTSASAAPTPPLLTGDGQSPQSSSIPSTNASCIGGPAGSRKSSTSNTVEVMTPTST
ncbi:MAG: hypothetical protein L6R35_003726 [Caloplaca aegaea]|nr:MAG: hypothetical protein L6R35_003726 [Caloplaca aegaea]